MPEYLIMDQDSAFMSTFINYLFKKLGIKIKMVVPFNHQSFQGECGIQSSTTILTKYLTGQYWLKYLPFTMHSYNTFSSPNLNGLIPFDLVFHRNPRMLIDFETNPNIKVPGTFKEYYKFLSKTAVFTEIIILH